MDMRPEPIVDAKKMYECSNCGKRITSARSRVCDACGGPLVNLGVERDL